MEAPTPIQTGAWILWRCHVRKQRVCRDAHEQTIRILRGAAEILAAEAQVEDFRLKLQLEVDLSTDLRRLLALCHPRDHGPIVVLILVDNTLQGVLLALERRICGLPLGFVRVGDAAGDSALIAPATERLMILKAGLTALLRMWRYHTVIATVPWDSEILSLPLNAGGLFRRAIQRTVRRRLPVQIELASTVERFSKKKRKNLLYYQRKLVKEQSVDFVASLSAPQAKEPLRRVI